MDDMWDHIRLQRARFTAWRSGAAERESSGTVCKYLEENDRSRCRAFSHDYYPDKVMLADYCHAEKCQQCPFSARLRKDDEEPCQQAILDVPVEA